MRHILVENGIKGYNKNMKSAELAKAIIENKILEINKIEPEITKLLKNISKNQNSEMFGLEYRIKSKESLLRKILSDAKEKEISLYEACKQIKDCLRYTILNSENEFTEKYFSFISELKANGYNIVRVKNTFKQNVTYKGINTFIEKDGFIFELQFHTPKSVEIKEHDLHKLYEEQRILDKIVNGEKYDELTLKMIEISNTIPIPKNVERIR